MHRVVSSDFDFRYELRMALLSCFRSLVADCLPVSLVCFNKVQHFVKGHILVGLSDRAGLSVRILKTSTDNIPKNRLGIVNLVLPARASNNVLADVGLAS